jgi:hypothetical protein
MLEMKEVLHSWTYYGFKDVRGYNEGLLTNFDGQVVIPKNVISRTIGVRIGQKLFRLLMFWNPHMSFGSFNYISVRYYGAMDSKTGQWSGKASFGEGFRPPSKFTIKMDKFSPAKEKTLKEQIREDKRTQERRKKLTEELNKIL